jgi:hypothetical protein
VTSAGALTHHRDSRRIHAERVRRTMEPLQGGVIILELSRKTRFGRQPVVNGYDHAVILSGNLLQRRNSLGRRPRNKAAAVDMENCRPLPVTRSCVD